MRGGGAARTVRVPPTGRGRPHAVPDRTGPAAREEAPPGGASTGAQAARALGTGAGASMARR